MAWRNESQQTDNAALPNVTSAPLKVLHSVHVADLPDAADVSDVSDVSNVADALQLPSPA